MPRKADDSPVFQLKVTLLGSKPPIWRRIQVRGSTTLPKLHDILQAVMGWYDAHLHAFTAYGVEFGVPDPDWPDGMRSERRIRLDQLVARPKDRIRYQYDFGDDWEHDILVEKILEVDPSVKYPIVLAGRRASPPEDVGGIWGYYEFLEAINDPNHTEHADMLDWIGRSFDPEAFNLERINARLSLV
jgi:hypothetical protein